MSHPLNLLQELLLTLFLALGCAWFAIDLARKLRAPQPGEESERAQSHAPAPTPAPVAVAAAPAPAPVAVPAPVSPAPVAAAVASAPAPVAAASSPAPEPLISGVPAPHLAAITAVVHHLFKGRVRLASVQAASSSPASIDWAREGRRDIFTSHRVR